MARQKHERSEAHDENGFALQPAWSVLGGVVACLIFAVTLALALLSLLTWVRAPDWMIAWKLAILAGEFGHWLVLVALALAAAAQTLASGSARIALLALCLTAVAGLMRPVV